jgi:hypothetical protein
MPKTTASIAAVLTVLTFGLLAGCAGDDSVNPLPPPDAGADASKDASASDASKGAAGPDASGSSPDASRDAATSDAATEAGSTDAAAADASGD